jgi:hypothetical protein
MSASLHLCPAGYVSIHSLCERPWRPQEILWKLRITAGDMDALARRHHPWPVEPRIVRPEARSDRTRRPVQHDVGCEHIAAKPGVGVAVAIGPGTKLFQNPCGKSHRRVGERIGQRSSDNVLMDFISQNIGGFQLCLPDGPQLHCAPRRPSVRSARERPSCIDSNAGSSGTCDRGESLSTLRA